MLSENDIRKKLYNKKRRCLSKRVKIVFKRRPCNCQFNRKHILKESDRELGLCMLGVEDPNWEVDICETVERAESCPAYLNRYTRESIEQDFENDMNDLQWVKKNHLDIYTLMWVLEDTGKKTKIGWIQRLQIFFRSLCTKQKLLTEGSYDISEDM